MATLYEKNNTGSAFNHADAIFRDARWKAMSFLPTISHTITSVKLTFRRVDAGSLGTDITVSIRAVDSSNKPTGSDLTSGTIATSGISTTVNTVVEISFGAGTSLTADTKYAIVCRVAGDASNYIRWIFEDGDPYSTGFSKGSEDSGSTWSSLGAGRDFWFEEYGSAPTPADKTYSKQLVAFGNNEVWREATAGTMSEVTDASGQIDVSKPLNVAVAFQKLFIVNDTRFKVLDFVNTKIVTANVGTNAPDFGTVLTGASGAKMIVDYITATSSACTIYGKRTTTTIFPADDTITGTNPSGSPYGSAVSFTMTSVAEVAPPHWYDWTVFGADATNYGVMPDNAYQVCRYRSRLQLTGDLNYPHQWYQSRQFNPFDFLYVAGDAQSPVAGDDADAGVVGDIVKVGIPYSDDYLIFGCANELWVLSGDAAFGGELYPLDVTTGILGDRAWCWDDKGNLYIAGTVGLLRIPKGFQQIENLTIELWPNFINDLAFDSSLHRLVLAFDPENKGIHIFKTTLSDGTCSAWWYDFRVEGLFPDAIPTAMGIFCAQYYQTESPSYRKLLVGCNDGYTKSFDKSTKDDDGTAIDSYVGFAPLALSTHPRKDGIIKNLDLVSGGGASGGTQTDSDDVLCSVYVGRTAEQVIEKLDGGTAAAFTKTFTAPGWNKGSIDRRTIRGQWGGIVLSNNTDAESWSMERLIVDGKPDVGRSI